MEKQNLCRQCGKCCESIMIPSKEFSKIILFLKEEPHMISKLNYNNNNCIFLEKDSDSTTKCLLYNSDVRPLICQIYGAEGFECSQYGVVSFEYSYDEAEEMLENTVYMDQYVDLNEEVVKYVYKNY